MLSRYAILRGFKLGLTTSIAGIFDKRFLLPEDEPLAHKRRDKMTDADKEKLSKMEDEASLSKLLSKPEIEKEFIRTYVCRECKTNNESNKKIIEELKNKL